MFQPKLGHTQALTLQKHIAEDHVKLHNSFFLRGADKSLARPTFRCILFNDENISFDASLVIYI